MPLPAASLNAPAATLITAVPLLLAAGVKMAVTTLGSALAARGLRLPPLTARELALKLLPGASEKVKVIVAVSAPTRLGLLLLMLRLGAVVSTRKLRAADAGPRLPAASATATVKTCSPSASGVAGV